MVGYRPAVLRRADEVLVLEDGRIIERGTHARLVETSARYRQLYELSIEQPAPDLSA